MLNPNLLHQQRSLKLGSTTPFATSSNCYKKSKSPMVLMSLVTLSFFSVYVISILLQNSYIIATSELELLLRSLVEQSSNKRLGNEDIDDMFLTSSNQFTPQNKRRLLYNLSTNHSDTSSRSNDGTIAGKSFPPMSQHKIEENKRLIEDMFRHGYDGYMYNAFPASELRPLTCSPGSFHLSKLPCVTLIDALDTLLVMKNHTEFARSVERLRIEHMKRKEGLFGIDVNISVFETNIRIMGGLLAAHQLVIRIKPVIQLEELFSLDGSVKIGPVDLVEEGEIWKYDGFLLDLAVDLGDRLMPAFRTSTGIPYGTVNLLSGVPKGETPVASLAGGGTISLEFEMLTRLTGDTKYGNAAILATRALFLRRNPDTNLLGKHIDTETGRWKEVRSGIGTNSDSFYEYLLKFYVLYGKEDFWTMFVEVYKGVYNYIRTDEHWFGDVEMHQTKKARIGKTHVFESLAAFWPGLLVLLGELAPAKKLLNAIFLAREHLGFLPERFQYQSFSVEGVIESSATSASYPLRPELLESCYFLHLATKSENTSSWQWAADFSLHALEHLTKTECGYASVRRVTSDHNYPNSSSFQEYYNRKNIQLEDEMPSYFLSETIKYLYLIFDEHNILHADGQPYVFTTEAHPFHFEPDVRSKTTSDDKWSPTTRHSVYWNVIKQIQMKELSNRVAEFNLSSLLTSDHLGFHPVGKGEHISQHCPNYHHPSFKWVHDLGLDGGLHYEENYAERMNNVHKEAEQICSVQPRGKEALDDSQSGKPETVKLEMGEPTGIVEIAMVQDGFFATHERTGETLHVSAVNVPSGANYVFVVSKQSNGASRVLFADWNNNAFFL